MNKLPLFSEISVSGAKLLTELYDVRPLTPKGLIEIIIFNLYIVVNEYRLKYVKGANEQPFQQMIDESFEVLQKDLFRHLPAASIDSFINDRMQIYHREYMKIAQDANPLNWDAIHYLFFENPLGEYPSPKDLLFSNYFELLLFGEAMLNEIKFLKEITTTHLA